MAADIPHFKLNNGTTIPSIGMGCWMGVPGGNQRVYEMCANAIKAGYRHFDTADGYANEEYVGRAISDSGIPRSQFYVVTKLNNNAHHRVREAFENSLSALKTGYIDLFLMHWPQASVDDRTLAPEESPTIGDTWREMEKLLDTGKVKSIGVSNFGIPLLKTLLAQAKVVPVTNQVELHPCLPLVSVRKYCAEHGIVVTAYSPLGRPTTGQRLPTFLADEAVRGIATRLGATEAQVALSWAVQQGIVVVPKSENRERMKANIALVHLEPADIMAIDGIHKQEGMHRSLLGYHKEDGKVFGYTYEQLGWDMTKGGVVPS